MPRKPTGRDISGIVLLDKPAGITSNRALQRVKQLFGANKAGHTGSLDPFATGLLPCCLGKATRLAGNFLHSDKHYTATFKLGISTDTLDCEGEVVSSSPVNLIQHDIDREIDRFRGTYLQTPPMYSALKHQGQPLYKLARAGKQVDREAREVSVFELVASLTRPDELAIEVRATGGFYVRQLASDLGDALGCGAHVTQLRRIGVDQLTVDQAVKLEILENTASDSLERYIYESDLAVMKLPRVDISQSQAEALGHGQALQLNIKRPAGTARIYTQGGLFIGLAELSEQGQLIPKKILVTPDVSLTND